MKRKIIIGTLLATVLMSTLTVKAFGNDKSNTREIIEECKTEHINPNIVFATQQVYGDVDTDTYIKELGAYAELAGTEQEVDIVDAISEVLDCEYDMAMDIVSTSDSYGIVNQ